METILQILASPGVYITAAVVLIFAVIEGYKIFQWFKDRLNDYHKKKKQQQTMESQVCNIAYVSQKHTQALADFATSLNNINDELKDIKSDIKDIKQDQQQHIEKENEEKLRDKADGARSRILRFADELRVGTPHSEEMFNQILDDITFYQDYCSTHPHYQNQKAISAIALISEDYDERLKTNSFLTAPKEVITEDENKRKLRESQNKAIKNYNR